MIEKYSKESTVKLFKSVVGKTGNLYYPGIYSLKNPLPERFMTAEYVELISGGVEKEGDSSTNPITEKEAQKIVTEHKTSPGLIEEVNLNKNESKVEEKDLTPSFEPVKKADVLNINKASKSQIVALQGVGSKTADKIIELREMFPFSDFSDLNNRVQLTFGRDWNEFNLEF